MLQIFNSLNEIAFVEEVEQSIIKLCEKFPTGVIFSTSFGLEDQIITHIIATYNLPIKIFTLDTGRLFNETYNTWSETIQKYKINIDAYYPNENQLSSFVTKYGINSFYESVENRITCCSIRKVEPLKRALNGYKIWLTGIRSSQSKDRNLVNKVELDEILNIYKFHPLFNWDFSSVESYISKNNIPVNPLHYKGFVSIGCAPCTRAIQFGEDFRAGRWWWENNQKKECGLHFSNKKT